MKNTNRKIYIGCSGFSNRDWKGFFFPETLASKDQLNYYSTIFNTVEINSTFYRRPRVSTLQKWFDETPDDFKFFIKAHKYFTHTKRLKDCAEEIQVFCDYISEVLQHKLAGFLFQLPPNFKNSEENEQNTLSALDQRFLNIVEFRDASWWSDEVFTTFGEKNIPVSGVSIPKKIPEGLILNSPDNAYYRFHGKPVMFKSEYAETELQNFAEEVKKTNQDFYIYFNNTWGTAALKNALFLKKLLE